jgi:photosystem II stability/assembly factor-like uncharacterized protein
MARGVAVLLGTKKGVYVFRSGTARERWRLEGPHFPGQTVYHVAFDPRDGRSLFAGINMAWGGPRVEISRDLGKTWKTGANPAFPKGDDRTFSRTWHIEAGHANQPDVLWCGVEPAALFKSTDRGQSWEPVRALNDHEDRKYWSPGGGGLGLHSIAVDAVDPKSVTIGISSAGVYETSDGGRSWSRANQGTGSPLPPQPEGDFGCVHHLVGHPTVAGARFQQNHTGAYFKDAGDKKWTNVTKGLPTDYGFASAIHPRDPKIAYLFPLEFPMRMSPAATGAAVWRTRDRGRSWTKLANGLPRGASYEVMREGMATDRLDPAGVYFGTMSGEIWGSADEGRTWALIAQHLPPILSVETATL